jgi:polyisoprenoid-binding protein YceI
MGSNWLTWRAASVIAVMASSGSALAAPESYSFDKQHTEVRFSWDHLGLSRQSGRFMDVSGSLMLDPDKPETSTVEVTIKVPSLWTGIKELDTVLKGKEFFDTASNPLATFRSTDVKRLSDKTAQVTGDLTLNGQTKPVTLDVVWNFSGEHPLSKINPVYSDLYYSGFSAQTQIRRSDWGITRTIPYVSDEIQIVIEAELKRKEPASATEGPSVTAPLPIEKQ